MRLAILAAIILVVVLATVFRVARARRAIAVGRDLITLYFIAAVVLTIFYTWQDGF